MTVETQRKSVINGLNNQDMLADYQLAVESREDSLIGRKEVFMGKAKFGIFGDGKEVPQLAMARVFENGDFRSGYYRDQTFMMAIGQLNSQEFFAQLYAHADVAADPASAGRMMNGHFATRWLDKSGEWQSQTDSRNSSADISPTAGQMPRLLGLAYASKYFRNNDDLKNWTDFSKAGNEVAFGTIGNASTSEGHFFETMNAAAVLQVPLVMSVWDDEYGISVPQAFHTVKKSISKALAGMQRAKGHPGLEIFEVKAWDYPKLIDTYRKATKLAREEHVPTLIHVTEVTQPQGHSTSGSHERYKPKERLEWEMAHDCITKMREWIISEGIASPEEMDAIEQVAKTKAKDSKAAAWKAFIGESKAEAQKVIDLLSPVTHETVQAAVKQLKSEPNPIKANVMVAARESLYALNDGSNEGVRQKLLNWLAESKVKFADQYNSHLYSESKKSALNVAAVAPKYTAKSVTVDGREVLQACFDHLLTTRPEIFAFGEDVGKIGGVNQGFAGLQEKHGDLRVLDTGIRENTIIGQGIGCAMRGLRPIAEIQYLDYLLYGLQTLSDDLATLQYRTKGGQKAPLIIRTRGHRLEGVWHSGSPMGMIIHALRGIYVLTPRNMTQAAGMYNTMMDSDDPALLIESLNGYRLKEQIPDNLAEFRVPLGMPEVLKEGEDITAVTYGSTTRIVMQAAELLEKYDISMEVIDVQTLLPFDRKGQIVSSLEKTNRLMVIDEDVSGGASAFIMQQILERDNGYRWLDSKPVTVTSKDHRPAYGTDGDYFSKSNREDIFEAAYNLMHEFSPEKYPSLD